VRSLSALVLGTLACAATSTEVLGAPEGKEATPAFAAALAVPVDKVEAVRKVEIAKETALLVGLFTDQGGKRAAVVAARNCGAGRFCAGSALKLDDADAIEPLAVVDLAAPPKMIDTKKPALSPARAQRSPAVLLRRRTTSSGPDGKYEAEFLVVAAIERAPVLLGQEQITNRAPSGEGYETLQIQFEKKAGAKPDLVLLQHTLPRKDAPEQLPGPPLTIRLQAGKTGYERVGDAPGR
jgi:hypothetical protein